MGWDCSAGGKSSPANRNSRNEILDNVMSNAWTPERRAKQALAICTWKPWEKTTGPRTAEGRARSARNADRGVAAREKIRRECMATARQCWKQIALLERDDAAHKQMMWRLREKVRREGKPNPADLSEQDLQEGRARVATLLRGAAAAGSRTPGQ